MFEKCEIILSKFYYEGHEEDAFRDYRYLLPETDPDGAMAEALEALEAIRNDLKGASADIKIMLETKDVRKGYERFLEDKPDDMKGHWDVTVSNPKTLVS